MPEAYLHLNNNVKDKLWKMICSLLFLCVISGNCVVYSTFPNGTGPNRKEGKVWAVLPDNVPSFDRGLSKVHVAPASTPMKKFNSTNSRRSKFRREVVRMPRFYRRRSDLTSSGIVMSRHTPDRWLDASYDLRYGCPPGCQCGYLEVECRQMQLQGVPRGIPLSTEKLILVGNEIESLNRSSFEGLSNLKTLVVSNNRIRSIEPRTFDHLTSLRRLRLNRNELKSLSRDVLSGLSQLQRIDLRHNKLTCLDADLFRDLPELRHIYLSNNNLMWIAQDAFQEQKMLEQLHLRGNQFRCDCSVRPLIENFLRTNRLDILIRSGATCYMPDGTTRLGQRALDARLLSTLECSANDERYVRPPMMCTPKTSVSCSTVCDCSMDRAANCQRHELTSVPQDLPREIMELNLAHNHIEILNTSSFQNYRNLRKIVLDSNRISHVDPNTFSNLKKLSSLYMSSNKFQLLPPGLFAGLDSLRILYLHRNKISCLQRGSFEGLENLQILHLSENRIQTFPKGSFEDLRRLKYLYLVHNPLICDCRLAWLPPILVEKEAGGTQWARCAEPLSLQGHHVREVLPKMLRCDAQMGPDDDNSLCTPERLQCPSGCRCTEITSTPLLHARPDAAYRPDELGLISDGLSVDCSHLGLTELPKTLPVNTRELNLRGNQIQEIKSFSALTGLNGLQNLILDGNQLERIEPFAFESNAKLKKLILSNNSLTTFDHRILKGLENLEILLLQHNQLGCLNNFTFSHVPSLKIVMLNNNKLRCIAKGIFEKLNLESLSISSNPLKCDCHLSWLPDWLRENVDQVISGPSPPTCVEPEDLAGTPLASLARYHFTCNKPGEECGTSSKLTRPTEERTTRWPCTASRSVCCEDPLTTERSKCPDRCTCESDGVYCSDLGLTEIPENIPENTTKLYLERNQISEIHPERLEHLTKLHTLVLSYNEIRELQENAFSTLKSLKTLVLSHNNLQCIHQNAFKGLGGLRVLILQANNISSVPYGTFKELGQLNNIALGQNPFHCDCNGKWLNSFFRQQFLDNGVALCHSPANMQYKSLYHSKPGDFVCPWKRRYRRRANLSSVNTTQFGEDLTSALLVDDHGIDDLEIAEDAWSDTLELRRDGPFSAEERESLQIAAKCSPCMINPCAHNGQCIPMGQLNYRCQCKSPYHGTQCNLQEHVCAINPCQNGGTCETTPYSIAFRCVCPKDFRGPTCAERINSCSHNYCLNGGTCEQLGSDFRCNCPPEFHGKTCQRAVIYCEDVNPCLNGATCTQLPGNKYRCECERGWSGKNCHINQDDCLYNRCENGATCVDGINEYICKCRPGYAGVYCERPTWNPENHVTRMDRRVSAARRNQGVGSSQVRHSPIKIRSLSIPHLETPCAYHQCQNMATCVDSQTDGYQCRCQPGFSGQYCENLFSISLPSPHSYIAIVPPSRGALVPRGSLGLKMATHTSSGVVMYYAETVQTEHGEVPAHYLMVDLTDGYLRAMLSINRSAVHQQRSTKRINDGKFHKFELHVEGENLTLLVDDQWQIERPTFTMSNSVIDTAAHYLALNNPLYFGGAPADRLETAGRILHEKRILGITGCIRDIQINDRMTNIARLFGAPVDRMTGSGDRQSERPSPEAKHHGTAIGILPGCDKHQPDEETADEAGDQEPRQSDKEIPAWTVPMSKKPTGITAVQTGTCLNGACQNGGQCITLPGGTFKCECPQGYAGAHCEIAQTCRQETQKSYIRDPHTNCISTRKLTVRNCVGICPFNQTDAPAEFPQGLVLRKRRWENRSQQSIESVVGQNSATSCCQQSTLKYRRVRFRCLHGPNYDRTVKLIRGCTCQQCFA